jgi:hypothetical protein
MATRQADLVATGVWRNHLGRCLASGLTRQEDHREHRVEGRQCGGAGPAFRYCERWGRWRRDPRVRGGPVHDRFGFQLVRPVRGGQRDDPRYGSSPGAEQHDESPATARAMTPSCANRMIRPGWLS